MQRKTLTLQLLKKRGEEGVSTEELAKKFGYNSRNSAGKLMWLLRRGGHKINYDKKNRIFVLVNGKITNDVKKSLKKVNQKGSIKDDIDNIDDTDIVIKSPAELAGVPPNTKKGLIYNLLVSRGKEGATPEELSKCSGTKRKNVCYQIHAIRKSIGCKIEMVKDKYTLKSRNVSSYGSNTVTVSETDHILDKIGNKKLIMGIHKIRPEDHESYLDLLKNIIYYTKCAENMIETTELLNAVRKEISPL